MTGKKDNLIVWDWNGTLLADTSASVRAMNTVLKKLEVPPITRADYQKHYAVPLDIFYRAIGVSSHVLATREEEIHPLWHATYDAMNIRLRRGAKVMLQSVRKTSCSSVILSNYVVERIEQQAEKLGVREHFDDVLAFQANDLAFSRTSKSARLKEYLRARPARAGIIIGDTEEEISIGRDLGLVTVAITDGMCSTSRLRAMKPDFLVRALGEVSAIANRIFGGGRAS
jgi:phosphoglycolate phosphatase